MTASDLKVYLDYDQATLDHNYDVRAWAREPDIVGGRYRRKSADLRLKSGARLDLAYGPGATDRLDLFPASGTAAPPPLVVFVHGGGWQRGSRMESCFAAEAFNGAGVSVAAVDFALRPTVAIRQMVDQLRRAVDWIVGNAADLGVDPARIVLVGHSSGAHMVSAALAAGQRGVGAALCISGVYDLEAISRSRRAPDLGLSVDDIDRLSAARHVDCMACGIALVCGEHDPDEFKRQARLFAQKLSEQGKLIALHDSPDLDHFEIVEALGQTDSAVFSAAVSLCAPAGSPSAGRPFSPPA